MYAATITKPVNEVARSPFATMMIKWRKLRKLSQLDLSLESGVSQRHISFMESGRAKPSRLMVLALAKVLDIPLRDQNQLLNVAGFASEFKERNLDNEEMHAVHHALKMSLTHHEPYPAIVADRHWNLVMENEASKRFLSLIGQPEEVWQRVDPSGNKNVYLLTFHPLGLQPFIRNWKEMGQLLLLRLQREVASDPNNDVLNALFNEVVELSGLKDMYGTVDSVGAITPVFPMEMEAAGVTLKTFSMISSFGTAQDVTASELKVETFFPADDVTKVFFEQLAL